MVLNYMKEVCLTVTSAVANTMLHGENRWTDHTHQSLLNVLDKEELSSLEGQIKNVQSQLEERKKSLRHLQYELSSKTALPKTVELEKEIGRVKSENEITLGALVPFRGEPGGQSTITPMSAEDIQRIDKDFIRWRKEWVDRRKIYKESVCDCI
ncbi:hypothetical protein I314_03082 [Cryptococcus bacillisporus CA1873]|uniref:Uncharacterized protein n=1 Tax=Cryptococcus bacillisporus CA1873 TaxID=1296111 RepID=A0ABR5BBK0_CRYGA|nr:hypothetical protein I314_03082 [Cryptococcus bacillisporus CA1873]|eukprot:KIR63677.1 hypothetical protein I314_03082 [Cryptococcus gattii CA1873]